MGELVSALRFPAEEGVFAAISGQLGLARVSALELGRQINELKRELDQMVENLYLKLVFKPAEYPRRYRVRVTMGA